MDSRFHPAIAAIKSGDLEGLRLILGQDPALARARSSTSHPTLLQCLALDAVNVPNQVEMARLLIDAGAEINGPMVAAASINNVRVAALLRDSGAAINGAGGCAPVEEAMYCGRRVASGLLLKTGCALHNLSGVA